MPINYAPVFFSVDDDIYRLHFPYLLEGFEKPMLAEADAGRFNSDVREYAIKGYSFGNSKYDVSVKETGVDICPGKLEARFSQDGVETNIDIGLLANIKMRREQATQNRIPVFVNGKQV
jgi:hypothetical protein